MHHATHRRDREGTAGERRGRALSMLPCILSRTAGHLTALHSFWRGRLCCSVKIGPALALEGSDSHSLSLSLEREKDLNTMPPVEVGRLPTCNVLGPEHVRPFC